MGKNDFGGSAFGQREPLTRRLNGLVRHYPTGSGIIKEFIQNADDAKASVLKVVLDLRSHSAAPGFPETMRPLLGPALMVFNDSQFTLNDIESIQEIGLGNKSQSASKTGRFGLGFNAAYNVTDCPSFITGNGVYFFDPLCRYIPGANIGSPGWRWQLNSDTWNLLGSYLQTFSVVGLDQYAANYPCTAFRLPLRSLEQAVTNEISKSPFEVQNFEKILDGLLETSGELLLFLKYVTEFYVYKIAENGSSLIPLAGITTDNLPEVRRGRSLINDFIVDDAEQMLARLQGPADDLPLATYEHVVNVKTTNTEEQHVWRVISGLYSDTEGVLVNAMAEMLEYGEKALPWVGAAARLRREKDGKPVDPGIKGKVFCFLPLPMDCNLPIHVNGFFDLDSARQTLTSDQTLVGKDAARTQWNQALVRYGVAQVYRDLIVDLVEGVGQSEPERFYEFWPNIERDLPAPLSDLPRYTFRYLADKVVIRTAQASTWVTINQVWILPYTERRLHAPLVMDQAPIPHPWLPAYVRDGFVGSEIPVNSATPKWLRSYLKVERDLACDLADAPRVCLSRHESVFEILRYCLSDDPGSDMRGVPLALHADEKLHAFGLFQHGDVFAADEAAHVIFPMLQERFLHPECVMALNVNKPLSGVKRFDGQGFVECLRLVLDPAQKSEPRNWNPKSTSPPNEAWLQTVFEYIVSHKEDFDQRVQDKLKTVPLVPDESDLLRPMGRNDTPLLPPAGSSDALLEALYSLGIPYVYASDPLMRAIGAFEHTFPDRLIWNISGRGLVDSMGATKDQWREWMKEYDPEIHDPILDFFSSEQVLKNLAEHPDRLEKLKSLPIFPDASGALFTLTTEGIFFPLSFSPPVATQRLHLLRTGPGQRWQPLFERAEVASLEAVVWITDFFLPKFSSLSEWEQLKGLEWLRDEMDEIQRKIEREGASAESFRQALSQAALIMCEDGELRSALRVYDPNATLVRKVLGETAHFPKVDFYKKNAGKWVRFFNDLGMVNDPRPGDILRHVDYLIAQFEQGRHDVATFGLMEVFQYLRDNWEKVREQSVLDSETGTEQPLSKALCNRAWLPAQRDVERMKEVAGYRIPEERLYKPVELFMPRDRHLVASCCPILPVPREPSTEMRDDLNFPSKPSLAVVTNHFDHLLHLWHDFGTHSDITEDSMETSVKEIYRFLGREASDAQQLAIHYGSVPCLWDSHRKKFWKPYHTFFHKIEQLEPWRIQFCSDERDIEKAYNLLGRREFPEIKDYSGVLEELAQEHVAHPLLESEIDRVCWVITALVDELDKEGRTVRDLVVLTHNRVLAPASQVFVADAPWYEDQLDTPKVKLLHPKIAFPNLFRVTGILRLSSSIREQLVGQLEQSTTQACRTHANHLQRVVRSTEFATGLRRLLQSDLNREEGFPLYSFNWLMHLTIAAVRCIEVQLSIEIDGKSVVVGSGETPWYFDKVQRTLYLAERAPRLMSNFLATFVNSGIPEEWRLTDRSFLMMMVDVADPQEIYALLSDLRVPDLQEADPDAWYSPPIIPEERKTSTDEEISDLPMSTGYRHDSIGRSSMDDGHIVQDGISSTPHSEALPGEEQKKLENSQSQVQPQDPFSEDSSMVEDLSDLPAEQDGKSRHKDTSTRRLITYVGIRTTSEPSSSEDGSSQHNLEIGDAAVALVEAYEKAQGRIPRYKGQYNKGYDIESFSSDGELCRFIEVKGIEGKWGIRGTTLSPTQHEYGLNLEHRDRYWLYIVEHCLETEKAVLWMIHNPIGQITDYGFDYGWQAVAEQHELGSLTGENDAHTL